MKRIFGKYTNFLIFTFLLIIGIVCVYIYFFYDGHISEKTETWGQFGDYFGGILNPILTAINFILLILNLRENKEKEEENRKTTQKQLFESIFFNMIDIFYKYINSYQKGNKPSREFINEKIIEYLKPDNKTMPSEIASLAKIIEEILILIIDYQEYEVERSIYMSIVKAQLNDIEREFVKKYIDEKSTRLKPYLIKDEKETDTEKAIKKDIAKFLKSLKLKRI